MTNPIFITSYYCPIQALLFMVFLGGTGGHLTGSTFSSASSTCDVHQQWGEHWFHSVTGPVRTSYH